MKRLENELKVAIESAKEAGKVILDYYISGNAKVKTKSNDTPVTEADLAANEIIYKRLRESFPEDGIVSEEMETFNGGNGRCWYIDPIDGTKSFIRRTDHFAVHIGLAENEKVVLGVVYKPTTGEIYYGVPEWKFATRRNYGESFQVPLKINGTNKDLTAIASNSFWQTQLDLFRRIGVNNVLVSGSLGLRFMKLAENQADFYLSEGGANTWDVCAPHAILEAAGGYVRLLNGEEVTYKGAMRFAGEKRIVAARTKERLNFVRESINNY